VGKEIIGVFGSRFGKSGMSLVLSVLTMTFGTRFGFAQLVQLSVLASSCWLTTAVWLSNLLPRKAQAQKIVEERLKGQKMQQRRENGDSPSDGRPSDDNKKVS
jgi:ATP/ADP translocase